MKFISTRDIKGDSKVSSAFAIKQGLAPDGGLYVPEYIPQINEEFVSSSTEFETVEEYRNSIKERLTKEANDRADIELDNDILDKIIDDTVVNIPEIMV